MLLSLFKKILRRTLTVCSASFKPVRIDMFCLIYKIKQWRNSLIFLDKIVDYICIILSQSTWSFHFIKFKACIFTSSHQRCFVKKGGLLKTRVLDSFLNNVASPKACNFIRKRLKHKICEIVKNPYLFIYMIISLHFTSRKI